MIKYVIAGIVVAVVGIASVMIMKSGSGRVSDSSSNTARSESSQSKTFGKKACELIDLEAAKSLLGSNATLLEGSGSDNLATTESVSADNCSYSSDGATLGDMKQLTIQVHSGDRVLVKEAYENFRREYPGDDLPGLGDAAYITTESGQVSVLKGSDWFFVFGGSMNGGDAANKELATEAAKVALKNL